MNKLQRILSATFIGMVLLGATGAAVYYYRQYSMLLSNAQLAQEKEHAQMLSRIGEFMALPQEKPTIVSITDREKFQNQQFFQKAQNGDKIVIFEAAKRVMLYRPSTKKVIDVAPLVYTDQWNEPIVDNPAPLPELSPTAGMAASPSAIVQ